jgi:excisionase family DNA binding protein
MSSGDMLTKQQAAEMLGVSPRQIQRWIADRKLVASRPSHKILRIRRQELERFMERNRL